MEKDGLYMQTQLMHQKFQLSGILGCILHQTKLKSHEYLKNMIGKNLTNHNLTGTEEAYYPNKNKDVIKKKYSSLERVK